MAAGADKQALRQALRELLKEEPGLILDMLRDNSETVLDIAQQGSDLRRRKMLTAQWQQDIREPKSVKLADRPALGTDKAPVTIVAFTDFTCLYCRQAEETIRDLLTGYPGQLRVVYKSFPMRSHPGAVEAAEFMLAASLQDKDKSWKLFENFFNNREKILSNEGQAYMRSAAQEAGLNLDRLLKDAKGAKVQLILTEDQADASALQVQGTPHFLVNNLVVRGAMQENLFRLAVDMALAETGRK
jgi:protein-disulfide isomerase